MPPAWAPAGAPRRRRRPAVELADIFRAHGSAYRRTHALSRAQRRAMRAIETCRTAALGGHRETCDTCGAERLAYNSCRNRHCPKCQTLAKERWIEARRAELLPVEYFHVVFTLPHALNALAQGNPRVIYRLLFRAVAATLTTFGRDPRHLGGDVGGTAILHTWGQNLSQHLHLHCVVAGGALAQDGARWIAAPPGFLFPVRALARVFRGKYLQALHHAFITGKLLFAGSLASLADPGAFAAWLHELRQHDWVVYAKRPFAGPAQVLEYLGRYTHRVAISNNRLLSMDNGKVRFRWKDYRDGNRQKTMTLDGAEFIRRFLIHVLPDRFHRIGYYGFLGNCHRARKLDRCRELLRMAPAAPAEPPGDYRERFEALTGRSLRQCPHCHAGTMVVIDSIMRPAVCLPLPDTS